MKYSYGMSIRNLLKQLIVEMCILLIKGQSNNLLDTFSIRVNFLFVSFHFLTIAVKVHNATFVIVAVGHACFTSLLQYFSWLCMS